MDDLLVALAGAATTANHLRQAGIRLRCHPSVEYALLALPGWYPAATRDDQLRAAACGLDVEPDPGMAPGQWRIELAGLLPPGP